MKTVEAGVKTLKQGLQTAGELSLSIEKVVNAFNVLEIPSKSELQKMLNEADLPTRWYIYLGFRAITGRQGMVAPIDKYNFVGHERERDAILFSIEECIERSMESTDDPKKLRKILRWTDKDLHSKLRNTLIKKLAKSLSAAIPTADDEMLQWIEKEGCLKGHVDFYGVTKAVNEESDKRALMYVEANEDSQCLLSVLRWNASYDTKRQAWVKALANTTVPELIFAIVAENSFGHHHECHAWDKFVDNIGDDAHRLWIAVDAKYSESSDNTPRSKALSRLMSMDKSLPNLLRIDRYRLRCKKFPYQEMQQALTDFVQNSTDDKEVKSVYEYIARRNKGSNDEVYESVLHAAVLRLYELSPSK